MSEFLKGIGDLLVEFGGKLRGEIKKTALKPPEKLSLKPKEQKETDSASEILEKARKIFVHFSGEQDPETVVVLERILTKFAKKESTMSEAEADHKAGIGESVGKVTCDDEEIDFILFITRGDGINFVRPIINHRKITK